MYMYVILTLSSTDQCKKANETMCLQKYYKKTNKFKVGTAVILENFNFCYNFMLWGLQFVFWGWNLY